VSPLVQAWAPFHGSLEFHAGTFKATAEALLRECRIRAVGNIGPFKVFGHGRTAVPFVGWAPIERHTVHARERQGVELQDLFKCLQRSSSFLGIGATPS
jgi:hypothetical protein